MNDDNIPVAIMSVILLIVGFAVAGLLFTFTQFIEPVTFNLTEDEIFLIAFSIIIILILAVFIYIKLKKRKEELKDDLKDVLNQMSQKKENKGEITW